MKEVHVPGCTHPYCNQPGEWELVAAEEPAEVLCWSHGLIRFGVEARQVPRPLQLRRAEWAAV